MSCLFPWSADLKEFVVQRFRNMRWPSVESLAGAVMLFHIVVCPYTKVEESFNIQATHDILYHRLDIEKYDHLEFPGVVPRTFLGPLVLAMTTAPAVYLCQFLKVSKFLSQYLVRIALGLYVLGAFSVFGNAIKFRFGPDVKRWLYLITVTQFHFMFYMSRPLPNTFALVLVLLALAAWIKQNHTQFLWISGAAIIIFRSELAVFLGLILAAEIFSRRLSIGKLLKNVVPAGFLLLGLTVLVDSFFWRRWLWPEGEVLWFNTVDNQSSKWGVSFHCPLTQGSQRANKAQPHHPQNFKSLNSVLNSNPSKKSAYILGKNSDLRPSIDLRKVGDGGACRAVTLKQSQRLSLFTTNRI